MKRSMLVLVLLSVLSLYNFKSLAEAVQQQQRSIRIDDVLERLQYEQVQFVTFNFCDLMGNLKNVVVPINHVERALKNGLTFDSSSIAGYSGITESDMILKADLNSLRIMPWTQGDNKTAWLMCNVYKNATEPYEADPRHILQKISNELNAHGYQFNVGPELEFFLFKRDENGKPTMQYVDNKKYFDPENNTVRQEQNNFIIQSLQDFDINVEKLHHEVANGQHEFSIRYGNAVAIADQIIASKFAVKLLAQRLNMQATFMPKPVFGQNGSGMHVHFSLYDLEAQENAFFDAYDPIYLSDIGKSFIAGTLKYIREFSSLLNPTINSYKRLVPGFEAPVYICWGSKNRSALIRIPLMNEEAASGMRAEIRCPDASCNPYLAFAGLLKAGVEGLKQNLEFPKEVTDNLYKLNQETIKQRNIISLPTSLSEALDELEKSSLAQQLLGYKAWTEFLHLKRKECQDFSRTVTNWELENYL